MKKDFQRLLVALIMGTLVTVAGCQSKKPKLVNDPAPTQPMKKDVQMDRAPDAEDSSRSDSDAHHYGECE